MSNFDISSSIDDLTRMIDRIILDRDRLPEAGELAVVRGSNVGVTSSYYRHLDRTSTAFDNLLRRVRADLDRAGDKIQATIKDIQSTNETVLDAIAGLDSQVVYASDASSPSSGAAAAAGATSTAAAKAAAGGMG